MTGNHVPTQGGLPPGPPWPLDLLADLHADLHAGLLEPDVAGELRRRVDADPEARATFAALDATREDLAALPAPRIPDEVAARIDAAIATEVAARTATTRTATARNATTRNAAPASSTAPTAPTGTATVPGAAPGPQVVDLTAERARRRRGLIAGAGLLTAAAAAVAVVAVVNLGGGTTAGDAVAGATSSSSTTGGGGPLALSSDDIGSALDDALGATDYGPLAGADRLDGCLRANGVRGTQPVGGREVTLDGQPGVLVVLPAGANPPRWRLLIVGLQCGPGVPATLADTTTG